MPANSLNLPNFKARQVGEADHDYHAYAEVSNPPGVCTPVSYTHLTLPTKA